MDSQFPTTAHTIAVIGLSPDPTKISYIVASYMQQHGYKIIPVNPNAEKILDEPCYPSLTAVPPSIQIDIIDIFRKSEFVPDITREAIQRSDKPLIWMQEGIISKEAETLAHEHGLSVVMDLCIMKEHQKSIRS